MLSPDFPGRQQWSIRFMSSYHSDQGAGELQSDESLIWSLREFEDHRRAVEFARHFRSALCVYSSKVDQIYARYDILVPQGQGTELVVVPDLDAFTETFYGIPEKAIQDTGYTILPGGAVGRSGLFLHIPLAGDKGSKGRAVPLAAGLRAVADEFANDGRDFLPILTKGDLRSFRKQAPMLHLHRLNLDALSDKSRFEINDVKSTIMQKLRTCL
jgi:hypothetical protein